MRADKVQIQQVLLNLIVNAVEAMSVDSMSERELVVTTGLNGAGEVLVGVRDLGPGLDPSAEENAFEAFYTTKASGLGMGLSICRSIIESHGGRIWVTPNDPHGAFFQFTLPTDGSDPLNLSDASPVR